MHLVRGEDLVEGRWKNGLGVSWDIASDPPGADMESFGWRFAIARIDADVPFSAYPDVDRVFTLIEGQGLTLSLQDRPDIAVMQRDVPHAFPGDIPTDCRLHDGPCRALNLFLRRGLWRADVRILTGHVSLQHKGPILAHSLSGQAVCGGTVIEAGDSLVTSGGLACAAGGGLVYAALLSPKR